MQDCCLTPNYESPFISWGIGIFNDMIMMSGLF